MADSLSVKLVLDAGVSPTEDRSKVLIAARNLVGECSYAAEERDEAIVLRSSDQSCLVKIRDQLRDRRVRDAARRLLLKSLDGDNVTLMFNRQAAFVGVAALVSSAEESPLGPLTLHIECDRTEELIDWLSVPRPVEPQGQARRGQPTYS